MILFRYAYFTETLIACIQKLFVIQGKILFKCSFYEHFKAFKHSLIACLWLTDDSLDYTEVKQILCGKPESLCRISRL